jgi:hypothetical protein
MSRVLVIPDLHIPAEHPGALAFCRDMYREFNCNKVVFLGDLIDWHAVSFHEPEPGCPGALDEYEQAKLRVKRWHKAFPKAMLCIGNHDCRPQRLAKTKRIPEQFLKDYNTLWDTPGWTWEFNFIVDDVFYTHGTGTSGIHPAWTKCGRTLMSTIIGHCHSRAGLKWRVNPMKRIFSMDCGCLVNNDALQFAYGKAYDDKPILAAAVVLNGDPIHRLMPMARGERYHKSRFAKKGK